MRHQPIFWPFWSLHILQVCCFSSCIRRLLQSSACSDFVLVSHLRRQVQPKSDHWHISIHTSGEFGLQLVELWYWILLLPMHPLAPVPTWGVLWGHGDGQDLWRWADSSWETGEGATQNERSLLSALNTRCYKKGTRLQYPSAALLSAVPGSKANPAGVKDLVRAKGAAPAAQGHQVWTGPLWRDAQAWAVPG